MTPTAARVIQPQVPATRRPPRVARWPYWSHRLHRPLGWLAVGVAALLALFVLLAGTGLTYQAIATAQDRRAYPPPGRLVDVGGHRLHLSCVGQGSPAVVMEAGFGRTSLDWSLAQPALGATTQVCAYDRAGLGWSDPGPAPRTSEQVAAELHTLLAAAGVAGPYVLAGHSVSGLHVRVYAARYPAEVAGLVLLDPLPVDWVAGLSPEARHALLPPAGQIRVLQGLATLGVARALGMEVPYPRDRLPPVIQRQIRAVSLRPSMAAATYEEARAIEGGIVHAASGSLPAAAPLVVLVRGQVAGPADEDAAGKADAAALVGRSHNASLVVAAGSGHYINLDRPDLVVSAVQQVVQAARTGQRLAP